MWTKTLHALVLPIVLVALAAAGSALAQAPAPAPAPTSQAPGTNALVGVRNFTKVDATFACGGALSPEAFDALKQAGFKSIVNLRAETEQGAAVPEERAAAEKVGIAYIHLPFVVQSPDPATVDAFLKLVTDPARQPMLLHCASGGRASVFWAIKRALVDGWTAEKAMAELPELGKNVNDTLRTFALDYIKTHGKTRP
jgi:uncharacterized protein (TIGR01244 family)